MHIIVASWDVLDSILLRPSSIVSSNTWGTQVTSPLPVSTSDRLLLLCQYLDKVCYERADEERRWHVEIGIGISSMYVHMDVLKL